MIARCDRAHDHDPDPDVDGDEDEPRTPLFFTGCLIAFALGLVSWAGIVALVRHLFEEGF